MALDGIFLNCIKEEIKSTCVGARVDKVYQPAREEIILSMRSRTASYKLLLSAQSNFPRVHITCTSRENPQTPPMFCMLMRKHLCGATLADVRQSELDRVLFLDFNATNEIGDSVKLTLCIEIMAQHSSIILIDEEDNIIDSVKRVDFLKSSVRQILPGIKYQLPPAQDKLNLLKDSEEKIIDRIKAQKGRTVSAAILASLQGISPLVCRELACCAYGSDINISDVADCENLKIEIGKLKEKIINGLSEPFMVLDEQEKPIDFSFMNISQYDGTATVKKFETFSQLLDEFYEERDKFHRMKNRSQDLLKLLGNTVGRITKKINLQKAELEKCADREQLRIFAELISANQYDLKKGSAYYDIENYYDENKTIRIPADPALTPQKNSQKYYKEYKKANTAEHMLKELIENGEQELQYIESVLYMLSMAESESELNEIREELTERGYLKNKSANKNKKQKPLSPIEFLSDDGFKILVGRNNVQNDYLSLKFAKNGDLWLHTQDIHGSHVIIVSEGKEIPDTTIEQAAIIATYYSQARNSSKVPVDYTNVKNLKKPQGAPPGKVIYHVYSTLMIAPDEKFVKEHIKK